MNMKMMMGIIGLCIIIISAVGYISSISSKYNSAINITGFNGTEDKLNQTNTLAKETYDGLFSKGAKEEDVSITWGVVKLGINTVKIMWTNMGIFVSIIGGSFGIMTDEGGLLAGDATFWLLGSILALVFTAVIIWFVSLLLRWYA